MTREIKFRGKSVATGEWVQGYLFQGRTLYQDPYAIILTDKRYTREKTDDEFPIKFYKDEVTVVYPDSVGQYTGMRDKNGVEIYEGDILQSEGLVKFQDDKWTQSVDIEEVIWNDMDKGFSVSVWKRTIAGKVGNMKGCIYMLSDSEDSVIIGNVYDNPELIEKNK